MSGVDATPVGERAVVGYYVHHVGSGHLSRAGSVAAALAGRAAVTGLSSVARPAGWDGGWVTLPLDADEHPVGGAAAVDGSATASGDAHDVSAGGRLHWVPVGHAGLRERMAGISAWIAAARPSVIVSDVSVEVALLARLHGVPVVTVALPGRRDDEAHRLGFAVSSAIISAWPDSAEGMLTGLDPDARAKHTAVGAIARFPSDEAGPAVPEPSADGRPRVLVLSGSGGGGMSAAARARAEASAPDWQWDVIGGPGGRWVADPWPFIRSADVVVTHAGQNAVAEVAAARVPAVVIAQDRPHDEQRHTARALERGPWPVVTADSFEDADWPALLRAAAELDGDDWSTWNDGRGAARAADVILRVARAEDVLEAGL
ncbi:glycosyltransferase [Herbiconiux solani]|uniref:glycosyltransferase n=1 Tax=Herbiconiux solani TaxID=661329 RepID=UPI0008249DB8|nr:glycosyltransferase [Herbiconiux solani]